jgi:hypothetical protein
VARPAAVEVSVAAFAHYEPETLLASSVSRHYFPAMSAAEILKELPKLTEADRRAVRQRLLELAEENEAVALCDQAAVEGAMMLDRMEDEDARRKSQ